MEKLRVKVSSNDGTKLQKTTERIIQSATSTGASIAGPIPLPVKQKIFTVNRSVHVYKKSGEHFQLCIHKRVIDIFDSNPKTIDALKKVDMPGAVNVQIQVLT